MLRIPQISGIFDTYSPVFANIRLGGNLILIFCFRMSPPGYARRRDVCLKNVITTSIYTDHNIAKTDQFVQILPGLNDDFDVGSPGEEVVAMFHTVRPPGTGLNNDNYLSYYIQIYLLGLAQISIC